MPAKLTGRHADADLTDFVGNRRQQSVVTLISEMAQSSHCEIFFRSRSYFFTGVLASCRKECRRIAASQSPAHEEASDIHIKGIAKVTFVTESQGGVGTRFVKFTRLPDAK